MPQLLLVDAGQLFKPGLAKDAFGSVNEAGCIDGCGGRTRRPLGRRFPGARSESAMNNGVCLTTVTAKSVKGRSQPLRRRASEPLRHNMSLVPPCRQSEQTPALHNAAFTATFQPQIVARRSLQTAIATFLPRIVAELTFQIPPGTFGPRIVSVTTLPDSFGPKTSLHRARML